MLSPERVRRVSNGIREMRGGRMYRSGFGDRMRGTGKRWEVIERLFEGHRERLGLCATGEEEEPTTPYRRPEAQLRLFDGDRDLESAGP